MREIAEIELAIQGGTEKIETLGMAKVISVCTTDRVCRGTRQSGRIDARNGCYRSVKK